jgi:hypothetical protein
MLGWTSEAHAAASQPTAPDDVFELAPLDRPVRVALRLTSESKPRPARVAAWSHTEVLAAPARSRGSLADGTLTDASGDRLSAADLERIAWISLEPRAAYDLRRRLFDRDDEIQWCLLGIAMLNVGERELADRAFAVAERSRPVTRRVTSAARALFDAGQNPDDAIPLLDTLDSAEPNPDEGGEDAGGRDPLPPSPGTTQPDRQREYHGAGHMWPPIDDGTIHAGVQRVKSFAEQKMRAAGVGLALVETERFLMYSQLDRAETLKWAQQLDRMYFVLKDALEIDRDAHIFDGKCVIFIFSDREEYIAFERAAFNFDASRTGGVCHMRNGDVFVSFYKSTSDSRFAFVLVHETVHAFMYRYIGRRQLPTWANEGIADYVAGFIVRDASEPRRHWTTARQYVSGGGDPVEIMNQTYRDGTWFNEYSYPVSHMLVRFLLQHRPRETKLWIDAVKRGDDWRGALSERLNVTPEQLAQGFGEAIMNEASYRPPER